MKTKRYKLEWLDKDKNVLCSKNYSFFNISEARSHANNLFGSCQNGDVVKIKATRLH